LQVQILPRSSILLSFTLNNGGVEISQTRGENLKAMRDPVKMGVSEPD